MEGIDHRLLKLLGLDSSKEARRQLTIKLQVHVGAPGTPAQNDALRSAVVSALAENGGQVPEKMWR